LSELRGSSEPAIGVYRLTRDPRSALYWIAGIVFVPLAALFVASLFDRSMNRGAGQLLAVLVLVTSALGLRLRKVRLEILPDGFRYTGLFRDSRHRYEDVSGFRRPPGRWGGRSAEILAVLCGTDGRWLVSLSAYLEHPKRIREWVHEHFKDLDAEDAAAEKELLAQFKATAPGRIPMLRGAASIVNVASIALPLFLLLSTAVGSLGPIRKALVLLLFALPVIALALRARFGRLVTFESHRSRAARMDAVLVVPVLAGAAIAAGFPPLHYRQAWPAALAVALLVFFAARHLARDFMPNTPMAIFLFLASLSYGYGLVCFANAALDGGEATSQDAVVRSRSTRRGSSRITVSSAADPEDTISLSVTPQLVGSLSPGQQVEILVEPGALNIEWVAAVRRN
jgi:hypothetical protein